MRQSVCGILVWSVVAMLGSLAAAAAATPSTHETAAGYYNIANAYARGGRPGLAVVNYERADLLSPNDADVAANLRLVRQSAHVAELPASLFERAAGAMDPWLLTWLGLLGLILLAASALGGFFLPGSGKLRLAGALTGMALLGATACNAVVMWPKVHAAVVITDATPVRVTPAPMGDQAFALPEAETVTVTADHEDFVLIETRAGRTGWVSRNSLAWVVPPSR